MCWQSKRRYWEGSPRRRAGRWGNPGELLCHVARSLRFYGDGISFRVVSGQSFWFRVLPDGARIARPRWMPVRRILGGGRTHGISFWPFPNSSGWWWLVSSVFFTRTSCCKITYVSAYHCVWPGRVVSITGSLYITRITEFLSVSPSLISHRYPKASALYFLFSLFHQNPPWYLCQC